MGLVARTTDPATGWHLEKMRKSQQALRERGFLMDVSFGDWWAEGVDIVTASGYNTKYEVTARGYNPQTGETR